MGLVTLCALRHCNLIKYENIIISFFFSIELKLKSYLSVERRVTKLVFFIFTGNEFLFQILPQSDTSLKLFF